MSAQSSPPTPNVVAVPPALDVRDLTGPSRALVLHDVSLLVGRGGTHVILGPMQSGKSMLVRLLLGLERAQHGSVTIDGITFDAANPTEDVLRRVRRRVGVVFDGSALVSRLTLLENVELPLVEHTTSPLRSCATWAWSATSIARRMVSLDSIDDAPHSRARSSWSPRCC